MTQAVPKNFWVVVDTKSGRAYFVRFSSHHPTVQWFTTRRRDLGYCFASEADARRVAKQLLQFGRRAKVVTEPPRPAAPPPGKPAVPNPPEHLYDWVMKILEVGRTSDKDDSLSAVSAGYRVLARQHHPDRGGSRSDMQHLNAAVKWLRENWSILVK